MNFLSHSGSTRWKKRKLETTMPAAAGMGRPVKDFFSTLVFCTLKRASRSAPHTAKNMAVPSAMWRFSMLDMRV